MEVRTYVDIQDGNGFLRVEPLDRPEFSFKAISGFDDLRKEMSNNLTFTNNYRSGQLDYDRIGTVVDISTTMRFEVRFYYPESSAEELWYEGHFTTHDFVENDMDRNWLVIKPRTWDNYHILIKEYSKSYDVYSGIVEQAISFPNLTTESDLVQITVPDPAGNNNDSFVIYDDDNNQISVLRAGDVDGVAFTYVWQYEYPWNDTRYFANTSTYSDNSLLKTGGFILNGKFSRHLGLALINWVGSKHPDKSAYRLYDIVSNSISKMNIGLTFRCDEWISDADWYNVFMGNVGDRDLTERFINFKDIMEIVSKAFNGGWRLNGNELIFESYKDSSVVNGVIDLTNYSDNGVSYGGEYASRVNNLKIKDANIPIIEKIKLGTGAVDFSEFNISYETSSYGDVEEVEVDISSVETDFVSTEISNIYNNSDTIMLYSLDPNNGYEIKGDVKSSITANKFNGDLSSGVLASKFWYYNRYMSSGIVNDIVIPFFNPKLYKVQKIEFPFTYYVFNHRNKIKTEQGWGVISSAKWVNGNMEVELKF